jgi:predicted ATP-grasp superfamily ATP-dependent carboligase
MRSMKIFVYESITGGGPTSSTISGSLIAEGRMMLESILEDLSCLNGHRLFCLIDPARARRAPCHPGLQVEVSQGDGLRQFRQMVEEVDAVLPIAPETGGLLEALTAVVERSGKVLLGSTSRGIHVAANKVATHQLLRRSGIPTPATAHIRGSDDPVAAADGLGYPVVVKPIDGAGCRGVYVAKDGGALRRAVAGARREAGGATCVVQSFVPGVHASVSLLTDGTRCLPLTLNSQEIRGRTRLSYAGGRVPLDHPLRPRAFELAKRIIGAIRGLKGYVGIDMVLTDREVFVIEVNPRLTTSYVALRRIIHGNLGRMIVRAAAGDLPHPREVETLGAAEVRCERPGPAAGRFT